MTAGRTTAPTAPTAPTEPLGFAQLLIGLLDEGRRTATYKLAVLHALVDSCTLGVDAYGNAPTRVSTRDLELWTARTAPPPSRPTIRPPP